MAEHEKIRLNVGAGGIVIPGWTPIDRRFGTEAYPLAYGDNSVEEIRAVHILEHFRWAEVRSVLIDWIRVLKPGGRIRISVPNAEWVARNVVDAAAGKNVDNKSLVYLIGGQQDESDDHRSAFTPMSLETLMIAVGLEHISPWADDVVDCHKHPCSMNLEGYKPNNWSVERAQPTEGPTKCPVRAVYSVPRLLFEANMFCAIESLLPFGIPITRHTGAYWHQCLARVMGDAMRDGAEWILTIDYDTVFTRDDVKALLDLAAAHPEADAIAPPQIKREEKAIMVASHDATGKPKKLMVNDFHGDLTRVTTAHFGLTLMKVAGIQRLKKPWFYETVDENGDYGEGHIDMDIGFWHRWKEAGNTLYQANNIRIGHINMMIDWPIGPMFEVYHQYYSDFNKDRQKPTWQPPSVVTSENVADLMTRLDRTLKKFDAPSRKKSRKKSKRRMPKTERGSQSGRLRSWTCRKNKPDAK